MKKVGISADLERRLRAAHENVQNGLYTDAALLAMEVLGLLNSDPPKRRPGLGYSELVACFRAALGDALALPPKPDPVWIIRQVNKAKEMGLDGDSIAQLCRVARVRYPRGVLELEFLLRIATRLLAESGREPEPGTGTVVTGRGAQDG